MEENDTLQEKLLAVANRQRAAIRKIQAHYDMKVKPWCDAAGISEASLRNFLNGETNSMTSDRMELLANVIGLTVGQLLDGTIPEKSGEAEKSGDMISLCVDAIMKASEELGWAPSVIEASKKASQLHQYVMEYRSLGDDVRPSTALAKLYLLQQAA